MVEYSFSLLLKLPRSLNTNNFPHPQRKKNPPYSFRIRRIKNVSTNKINYFPIQEMNDSFSPVCDGLIVCNENNGDAVFMNFLK